MSGDVTVVRVSDQRWLVEGQPVELSSDADAVVTVLEHAIRAAGGESPLHVEVLELETTVHLVVGPDGSVSAAPGGTMTRALMRWLRPAGTFILSLTGPSLNQDADMHRRGPLWRACQQVGPQDWAAVAIHAFERSTLTIEAQSMGVSEKAYTEALARVRETAMAVTDGTVR